MAAITHFSDMKYTIKQVKEHKGSYFNHIRGKNHTKNQNLYFFKNVEIPVHHYKLCAQKGVNRPAGSLPRPLLHHIFSERRKIRQKPIFQRSESYLTAIEYLGTNSGVHDDFLQVCKYKSLVLKMGFRLLRYLTSVI